MNPNRSQKIKSLLDVSSKKRPSLSSRPSLASLKQITSNLLVSLAPCFVGNVTLGVSEYLDSFLMKYSPELSGIPLAYSEPTVESSSGRILFDSPFFHVRVSTVFIVFAPVEDDLLVGVVNKVSDDHIGLVVYGIFNASIGQKDIFSEFSWDWTDMSWSRAAGEMVKEGTVIKFNVKNVEVANNRIAIKGSLRSGNYSIIETDLSPPAGIAPAREAPESDEGPGHISYGVDAIDVFEGVDVDVAGSSKKRKLELEGAEVLIEDNEKPKKTKKKNKWGN